MSETNRTRNVSIAAKAIKALPEGAREDEILAETLRAAVQRASAGRAGRTLGCPLPPSLDGAPPSPPSTPVSSPRCSPLPAPPPPS